MVARCEGHDDDLVPASVFFRTPAGFSPLERHALELCAGRVLDVGAGAGAHALALAARGHGVVALDVDPLCVEVMRRRGVADARCGTTADVDDGPYDTLLMMMHGVGVVGTLDGLRSFLADAHRLLAPHGRILLDSRGEAPWDGALRFELEYRGERGAPFWWLFVGADELADVAAAAGWRSEVVRREEDGAYLARLSIASTSSDASTS